MPSYYREDFPSNAKVSEFNCPWCGTDFFARYCNTIYCSDLCRHNAYLERKRIAIEATLNSRDKIIKKTVKISRPKSNAIRKKIIVNSRKITNQ